MTATDLLFGVVIGVVSAVGVVAVQLWLEGFVRRRPNRDSAGFSRRDKQARPRR